MPCELAITSSSASQALKSLLLVCRPGDSRAKSLELFKDRVGRGSPDEWSGVSVVGPYELLDSGDQLLDAGKAATSNRSLCDDPKPAFHLIRP
jgi:hypothetical protein